MAKIVLLICWAVLFALNPMHFASAQEFNGVSFATDMIPVGMVGNSQLNHSDNLVSIENFDWLGLLKIQQFGEPLLCPFSIVRKQLLDYFGLSELTDEAIVAGGLRRDGNVLQRTVYPDDDRSLPFDTIDEDGKRRNLAIGFQASKNPSDQVCSCAISLPLVHRRSSNGEALKALVKRLTIMSPHWVATILTASTARPVLGVAVKLAKAFRASSDARKRRSRGRKTELLPAIPAAAKMSLSFSAVILHSESLY